MLFKVLTATVFIAELIITYTIVSKFIALDKLVLEYNQTLTALKPGIRDVGDLIKKISYQMIEFSYDFVAKIKQKQADSVINQLNKIVIMLILLRLNSKFIKKIVRSKHYKRLCKGLSLIKYVI